MRRPQSVRLSVDLACDDDMQAREQLDELYAVISRLGRLDRALILLWLLVVKLFGHDIGGRPLLLVGVMLVLMGAQFIAAGLIGELLTRIYHEAGGAPQFHAQEYVVNDEPNTPLALDRQAPAATQNIA